jgi:vancomycin resistance protein YoaR
MTTRTETANPLSALQLDALRRVDWGRAAFGFGLTLLAVAVLVLAFVVGLARAFDGRVTAGVSVAGVSVAGLTPAEAEARLREQLPSLSAGTMTLALEGRDTSIAYGDVGRDYDLRQMLDAATASGHTGSPLERTLDQVRSLVRGTAVEPVARYDQAAVHRLTAAAVAAFARAPIDARAELLPASGTFHVSPGTEGRRVELERAETAVARAIAGTDPGDQRVEVTGVPIEPGVTTAEAEAAAQRAVRMTADSLVIRSEDKTFEISDATLRGWVAFEATPEGGYAPMIAGERLAASLEPFVAAIQRPARNARYTFVGGRPAGVVPAVDGLTLDAGRTAEGVRAALAARVDGATESDVELAVTSSDPALTTAMARAALPNLDKLSSWTTYYPVGEKNFWGKNIQIPTSKIDGYTLAPGEWFDFWTVVGDPSAAEGYGPGGAIINGHTEPTGAFAGGICSCSTTLFNAAARAGLEIGDRKNHYYYITRYPVGLDATVFKSSSENVQSMSFRNDTAGPIVIHGINGYGVVTFEAWGIDDGREVFFSRPSISNYHNATDKIVYVTSLAPGVRKRVEYAVDGFNAVVIRTVKSESGAILHQDTWFSHYATITGIVEVGKARPRARDRNPGGNDDGGSQDGGGTDGGTDGGGAVGGDG